MNGMKKMTSAEMTTVTGGKCNSNYGYYFCCPANAADMKTLINYYVASGQQSKANKYIQFCYEVCGY